MMEGRNRKREGSREGSRERPRVKKVEEAKVTPITLQSSLTMLPWFPSWFLNFSTEGARRQSDEMFATCVGSYRLHCFIRTSTINWTLH